ncbi:acyl--CoA ligase [Anthocerotibacter panamensis]|uniref:acyl--CoA ligase n=1 Tax=Anthocerotibacter panamensis TaxID=2857077 RepID=UPI001C40420F|nr:acyl--CoA ligase [Anthocerotibacter panamensis]
MGIISDLLKSGQGAAPALTAPACTPLSYDQLRQQIAQTTYTLNALGLGRGDRIAMVLANGPQMAAAFLAVTATATVAPLNPAYRAEEFDFYLTDLGAKALLVEVGSTSPALAVAERQGVPVLFLAPRSETAGRFELHGRAGKPVVPSPTEEEDIALILHTSGTTARPKQVPLTQRNLYTSAHNIVKALALTGDDRCLNLMPLFHIHGLVAGLVAGLAAGGSIFCPPGFNALKFSSWLKEANPTWYTAVPTMHQAILGRVARNRDLLADTRLRFIRSSSAPLAPSVITELEATFAAPVIEGYGMTEAAHQITCNPLPPLPRKPGSVGIAAGPEVAILDSTGNLQPPGTIGEVGIRGENVMSGYAQNPQANASAFSNGWFRTGDQGVLDEEGYLHITGRLKEIINRGGEKIAPREVDEVLMIHPAVAQAVTFALPHPKLGEEVAVAIVLTAGQQASEQELRAFAAQRLADFKVPRRVVFLEQIPTGPTGKIQRMGLAERMLL